MKKKSVKTQHHRITEWGQWLEQCATSVNLPAHGDDEGPEPGNYRRACWASGALLEFVRQTGADEPEAVISDLICDLAHWCDRYGVDLTRAIERGQSNYEAETNGQGEQFEGEISYHPRFTVIGPDDLPLRPEPFKTETEAQMFLISWIARYQAQGYYSAVNGRIALADLPGCCRIERIAKHLTA